MAMEADNVPHEKGGSAPISVILERTLLDEDGARQPAVVLCEAEDPLDGFLGLRGLLDLSAPVAPGQDDNGAGPLIAQRCLPQRR